MKKEKIKKIALVAGTIAIGFGVKQIVNAILRKKTGNDDAVNPADSNNKLIEALGWTLSISVLTGLLNTLYTRAVHQINE